MVSALESSPSPRILTGCLVLMTPALRKTSGVMVVSPRPASRSRFTMLNSLRKMLVKPRLGMRRCSGIWPPSKPRIIREPLRERWPLWPRVEVLPMPEPMPRPTRFLFSAAFLGARMLERFINKLLALGYHNFDQVRNLSHHAANRGVVGTLDHLVEPGKAQPFDYSFVLHRSTNRGTHPLQVQFAAGRTRFLCRHLRNPLLAITLVRTCRALRPRQPGSLNASARRK